MKRNPNHIKIEYQMHLNQLVDMYPGTSTIGTEQLAAVLGCTKNTVYTMIEKDKIDYIRVGDLYRFPIVDVAKFLAGAKRK